MKKVVIDILGILYHEPAGNYPFSTPSLPKTLNVAIFRRLDLEPARGSLNPLTKFIYHQIYPGAINVC
jgi:hypothetical protein